MTRKSDIKWYSLIFLLIHFGTISTATAEPNAFWVAKAVSVEGRVEYRTQSDEKWYPVTLNHTFQPGDMIRIRKYGRAAILLCNDAVVRIDQQTTLVFTAIEDNRSTLLNLLRGAAHFFSRVPRSLEISTPFVNASIEGTEFFIKSAANKTELTVFKGHVRASNATGSQILASGQSAIAVRGMSPETVLTVHPRDSVSWALHYPPIFYTLPPELSSISDSDLRSMFHASMVFYRKGDASQALTEIAPIPNSIKVPQFFIYRASLMLSVGRVTEAADSIETALTLSPENSAAYALKAIIAVVQNQKDAAVEFAQKSVSQTPESSAAWLARSYVEQAHFDLDGALESVQKAVELDPENALAISRLAELWLSFGYLDRATRSAKKAVALNPHLAKTQTVLGYAHLTGFKTEAAIAAFQKAIELDSSAPLPRLGLGLAILKKGNLEEGRRDIEIAASLAPDSSLIRSYLGKAFFEEKRDKLSQTQFELAKELDPKDPTPWLYDAIRKQNNNRPVEALHDLRQSIVLNDNRAVYRSQLMLDQDLAVRSASLARIYNNLGFKQLALVEGWKSLNSDPSNYSAHRMLADAYAGLQRSETARSSALLLSQLLQPINCNPVQPHLTENNISILQGAYDSELSFNEYMPLFNRNKVDIQVSGLTGGNKTLGNEFVLHGLYAPFSGSIGQYHYETDGFRENNDQTQDLFNAFFQMNLSYKTTLQLEARYKDSEQGILSLDFTPATPSNERQDEERRTFRIGLRHELSPKSNIIGSVTYQTYDQMVEGSFYDGPMYLVEYWIDQNADSYLAEFQHIFTSPAFHVITGASQFSWELTEKFTQREPGVLIVDPPNEDDIQSNNLHIYSFINVFDNVTLLLGGSYDFFDNHEIYSDEFNPKLGITLSLHPATTVRAACFKTLRKFLVSEQTIEPANIAGFSQFYDDVAGTDVLNYGLGVDHIFSKKLYSGIEGLIRDIEAPAFDYDISQWMNLDGEEKILRLYLCYIPHKSITAKIVFQREELEAEYKTFKQLHTNILPFELCYFFSNKFQTKLTISYTTQKIEYNEIYVNGGGNDNDAFWIADVSLHYYLPWANGIVSIDAKNVFDEEFKFQEIDPSNSRFYPEFIAIAKISLTF